MVRYSDDTPHTTPYEACQHPSCAAQRGEGAGAPQAAFAAAAVARLYDVPASLIDADAPQRLQQPALDAMAVQRLAKRIDALEAQVEALIRGDAEGARAISVFGADNG